MKYERIIRKNIRETHKVGYRTFSENQPKTLNLIHKCMKDLEEEIGTSEDSLVEAAARLGLKLVPIPPSEEVDITTVSDNEEKSLRVEISYPDLNIQRSLLHLLTESYTAYVDRHALDGYTFLQYLTDNKLT